MSDKKFYLKGWLFLPLFAFPAICYSAPDASPQVLKNVRLVYQKECCHVVPKVSVFITCKAVKMDKPLRLLLHMPNTLSQSVTYHRIFANEIVHYINTTLLCRDSQPNSWVEVGLKKEDISFDVKSLKEEIWVALYTGGTRKVVSFEALQEKPPLLTQRMGSPDSSHLGDKLLSISTVPIDQRLLVTVLVNGSINVYDAFQRTKPPRLVVDLMGATIKRDRRLLKLKWASNR